MLEKLDGKGALKWSSLLVLIIQNAWGNILFCYVRKAPGNAFFSTTAIVCQEFMKLIFTTAILLIQSNNFSGLMYVVKKDVWRKKLDTIKTGVPALLYTFQGNLTYLAVSNLDATVFQVTIQIKILTTALFTVLLLNRSLKFVQWVSLFILFIGVSLIQLDNVNGTKSDMNAKKNAVFGLLYAVLACFCSSLAGVYFEKILKNSNTSIWVRNIQLGIFGTIFSMMTALSYDWDNIQEKGFFYGYNNLVWISILAQSAGGLIVAVVIKYADNILKGFANSISFVLSCIASVYLFNTHVDLWFGLGALLVIISVFVFSLSSKSSSSWSKKSLPIVDPVKITPKEFFRSSEKDIFTDNTKLIRLTNLTVHSETKNRT